MFGHVAFAVVGVHEAILVAVDVEAGDVLVPAAGVVVLDLRPWVDSTSNCPLVAAVSSAASACCCPCSGLRSSTCFSLKVLKTCSGNGTGPALIVAPLMSSNRASARRLLGSASRLQADR